MIQNTFDRFKSILSAIPDFYADLRESGAFWGLIIVGILFFAVLLFNLIPGVNFVSDYALNSWTELLGILAGVFMLDRLRKYRDERNFVSDMVRQAGSTSNELAKDAIHTLKNQFDEQLNLANVNLRWANLAGVDLSRTNLTRVDFSFANLEGANFKEANLENTVFIGATLTNALFSGATLNRTEFTGANLTNADFRGITNDKLHAVIFRSKAGEDKYRQEVPQKEDQNYTVQLVGTLFENIDFTECDLTGIEFNKCEMQKAKFSGMNLRSVRFCECMLQDANLENVQADGTELEGCTLNDANLYKAYLRYANLVGCELERAAMKYTQLQAADYTGANFREAEMHGADLTAKQDREGGLILYEASFIDARFDGETKLPDGSKWSPQREQTLYEDFFMARKTGQLPDKETAQEEADILQELVRVTKKVVERFGETEEE